MALLYNVKCKACKIIRSETPRGNRFEDSKLFRLMAKHMLGLKSYRDIQDAYPELTAMNIQTHKKKHQTVAPAAIQKAKVSTATIQEIKAEVVKIQTRLLNMEQTRQDISELIEGLMSQARGGELTFKAGDLIRLLGLEQKSHEKEKDQGIAVAGMLAKYTSGELSRSKEPDAD